MKFIKFNLILKYIYVVMFSIVVNAIIYFSFSNIYSSESFNLESFSSQYDSGVYQYRFLSTFLLLKIYDFISWLDLYIPKQLLQSEYGDGKMIMSFYIINTFFLSLFSMCVLYILNQKEKSESLYKVVFLVGTAVITQYVVVPYDMSSYFFLVLFYCSFVAFLRSEKLKYIFLSSVILIIATLNRESSALFISLGGVLLYIYYGISKKSILNLILLCSVFIITYFGLRLYFGNFSTNDGNLFVQNFTQVKNYFGILFNLIFFTFTLLVYKKEKVKLILLFHFFSLPYIFMCFYTGILYEVRLYVPLFIGSVLIGEANFGNLKISFSNNLIKR